MLPNLWVRWSDAQNRIFQFKFVNRGIQDEHWRRMRAAASWMFDSTKFVQSIGPFKAKEISRKLIDWELSADAMRCDGRVHIRRRTLMIEFIVQLGSSQNILRKSSNFGEFVRSSQFRWRQAAREESNCQLIQSFSPHERALDSKQQQWFMTVKKKMNPTRATESREHKLLVTRMKPIPWKPF